MTRSVRYPGVISRDRELGSIAAESCRRSSSKRARASSYDVHGRSGGLTRNLFWIMGRPAANACDRARRLDCGRMDWKIELIAVPVSDVDRAKAFYEQVGFNADHDHRVTDDLR